MSKSTPRRLEPGDFDPMYGKPAPEKHTKPRRPTPAQRHLTRPWARPGLLRHLYADHKRLPECRANALGPMDLGALIGLHDRAHFRQTALFG